MRRLALVLLSLAAGVLAPAPAGAALLWQISDPAHPEARLHALATVSLSQEDQLRFDPTVLRAFEGSQRLVLPNSAVLAKQNALIGWKAHLEAGDNLANWLSPELMAGYVTAVGRAGYPPTHADVTAPWFAARMVRAADLRRAGYEPERELLVYFTHLARERGEAIEILPLEESATSYDRQVALTRPVQSELMRRALLESARADQDLPAAAKAWARGDAVALDAILRRSDREHPELSESRSLTIERENDRLAGEVARLLSQPGAHRDFLLADARNLLGAGGTLKQLRERGLRVERVLPQGGTANAYEAPPLPAPAAKKRPAAHGRVLLVGIDGATLRLVRPLIAQGRLPTLAALARDGASGPLRSHRPIYSPRIWNSIVTGKTPAKHGVEGFTFRDAEGKQQLFRSVHRKAHALWNIASKAGLWVGVVNWWNTYPPEVINGVMVSDHAKPTRLAELRNLTGAEAPGSTSAGATVFPASWHDRVAEVYARRLVVPGTQDPFLGNLGIPPWMKKEELSKRFRDDAAAARIALDVKAAHFPDLLMVFLPGIDRVSHRLWGALEPAGTYEKPLDLNSRQREAARRAIEDYYVYSDVLLGLLAEGYGADDLVMVVSDHGFEAGEHLGDLTGVHEGEEAIDGILFARGPGIQPGSDTKGTSVNDVTPTLLAWLGLPIGRDMDGSVAAFYQLPSSRTIERIATHDTGPIERGDGAASGSEQEILDQLRALGYIE